MEQYRCAIILNEASFGGGRPHGATPLALLEKLALLWMAVERQVPQLRRGSLRRVAVVAPYQLQLVDGISLASLMAELFWLSRDLALWFQQALQRVRVSQDGFTGVELAGAVGAALTSLDVPEWRVCPVIVGDASICNVWDPDDLDCLRESDIARGLGLCPNYENPGHHDPTSPDFDPTKSRIPVNARELLEYALPADEQGVTWWAQCMHGHFHRYSGQVRAGPIVVHWNGTTNPKATQVSEVANVPSAIRLSLEAGPHSPVCGCRDL